MNERIDTETFGRMWTMLRKRFGTNPGEDQARAYLAFLVDRMDRRAFVAAAHALWATARWFPRPADFLTVDAPVEWRILQELLDAHRPPYQGITHDAWDRLSPRAQEAVRALGGIPAVKDAMDRGPVQFRQRFLEAYELAVVQEAVERPLLPAASGAGLHQLEAGEDREVGPS